jgi:TetR/AcrR family transcriptional regulator
MKSAETQKPNRLTAPKATRLRGRPAEKDTGACREGILNSAETLFAQKGFAATSIREIASTVGVTPAMVHYYFGNKIQLLRNVLDRTLQPLAEAVAAMRETATDPLRGFTTLLIRMASEHPNLLVLLTREVILPGGQLQAWFLEHFAPRLGGALPGLLAAEQERGRLHQDYQPHLAAMLILSMCVFPFVARSVAQRGLGMKYDADGIGQLLQHVDTIVQRGFKS